MIILYSDRINWQLLKVSLERSTLYKFHKQLLWATKVHVNCYDVPIYTSHGGVGIKLMVGSIDSTIA